MKKKGSALIVVIIVMMLVFSMAAYMMDTSIKNNRVSLYTYNRTMAYYSAESEVYDRIYAKIKADNRKSSELEINSEGTYGSQKCIIVAHVSITYDSQTGKYTYSITSKKIYKA